MKRIFVIFLTLLLLLNLAGCGDDSNDQEKDNSVVDNSGKDEETETETESDTVKLGDEFTIGEYAVTLNSIRTVNDYDGNPAIVLNFNWTNNSEETTSWMTSTYTKVFQDGVELETAFVTEGSDSSLSMKDVRPGVTLEGIEESFITTSESNLEIEVEEFMSFAKAILIIVDYPTE